MHRTMAWVFSLSLLISACSASGTASRADFAGGSVSPAPEVSASSSVESSSAASAPPSTEAVATSQDPNASVTPTSASARGTQGQVLWASPALNLDAGGSTVVVRGSNFDESIGIYVALCVIPNQGQLPTPCGGGVDQAGSSGASAWVSSNAPNYGKGLATAYLPGGDFEVRISFTSRIGDIDCRQVKCAIVSRADHLRSQDRSADVFIPVSFRK